MLGPDSIRAPISPWRRGQFRFLGVSTAIFCAFSFLWLPNEVC
jgi:hypothetical protein